MSGIDPYAAPCPDVYQDMFAKAPMLQGIYEVDTFEAAVAPAVFWTQRC